MRYGIGYKGSKSRIANDILSVLPSGERFVDLFGGGFAMSHAALLSGKYKQVLYNDVNPLVVELVMDAIRGKYNQSHFVPTWISREEFNEKRDTDGYIKYCWSYGNNGKEYMYPRSVEELKKNAFNAICLPSERERRLALKRYTRLVTSKRIDLESLERLERLESSARDYRDYEYRQDDVVYCDIPYEQDVRGDHYGTNFSHADFYEWAITRKYPVFFSSTWITAEGFKSIWQKERITTMKNTSNSLKMTECLYVQEWYEAEGQGELMI